MKESQLEMFETLAVLMDNLQEFFEDSIKAGVSPEGLIQMLVEGSGSDFHRLKRELATPVDYTRRLSIEGKVTLAKKEDPNFKLGMNTSFYAPYKGLTNTVRVHHDFLIYPLGEFKQVMIEEDGTFFVTVDKGQLHVLPDFNGVILAKISTTNPTIGRRYDSTPPIQPQNEPNLTGSQTQKPTGAKRGAKGVDQEGNTGTSR